MRQRIFAAADFIERYVLSLLYLWLAWRALGDLSLVFSGRPIDAGLQGVWLVQVIRAANLVLVQLLIGLLLLRSRKPAQPPREWREILVPLAVSLFFVLYSAMQYLPPLLTQPLASPGAQTACAILSAPIGLAGSLLAVWGVIALGRSFGIFVVVRKVVLVGPYKFVRHPIYSGYVLIWLGLILANLSPAVIAIVAVHTALMVYRARLEERRLGEASPEYREYVQRTGFLFPRLDSEDANSLD